MFQTGQYVNVHKSSDDPDVQGERIGAGEITGGPYKTKMDKHEKYKVEGHPGFHSSTRLSHWECDECDAPHPTGCAC